MTKAIEHFQSPGCGSAGRRSRARRAAARWRLLAASAAVRSRSLLIRWHGAHAAARLASLSCLLSRATGAQDRSDVDDVVDLGRCASAAGILELATVLVAGEHAPPHVCRCAS